MNQNVPFEFLDQNIPPSPRLIHQVMVSSTFTDLEEHRAALIKALNKHKLHPNVMEYDDAKVRDDVIESSLQMVRDSAAYILLIGAKYGQTPEDPDRNPNNLSITELSLMRPRGSNDRRSSSSWERIIRCPEHGREGS